MSGSALAVLAEARRLSADERLDLIGELWDTLDDSELPVSSEERAILEARMADLEANPEAQEPWPQVKAWLESRRA